MLIRMTLGFLAAAVLHAGDDLQRLDQDADEAFGNADQRFRADAGGVQYSGCQAGGDDQAGEG